MQPSSRLLLVDQVPAVSDPFRKHRYPTGYARTTICPCNMGITQAMVANQGAVLIRARPSRSNAKGSNGGTGGTCISCPAWATRTSMPGHHARAANQRVLWRPVRAKNLPGSMPLTVDVLPGVSWHLTPARSRRFPPTCAAADRGRLGAVENFTPNRAGLRRQDGGADSGSDLRSQLAEAMAMPTNTFVTDLSAAAALRHQQGIRLATWIAQQPSAASAMPWTWPASGWKWPWAQHTLADQAQGIPGQAGRRGCGRGFGHGAQSRHEQGGTERRSPWRDYPVQGQHVQGGIWRCNKRLRHACRGCGEQARIRSIHWASGGEP